MYDPSRKLNYENSSSSPPTAVPAVVSSQPVGFHSGTHASPVPQAQQFVYPAPSSRAELLHVINTGNAALTVQRPVPGKWKDSICDWPQNLFPSCYCVCCCCYGCWLLGQSMSMLVWLITFIMALFIPSAAIWLPIICFYVFALVLRMHFVRQQNIDDNPLGLFGEFCCGVWCWYCSMCQMARHLYGYSKVLDGDGDPYRADGYGPIREV